MVSGAHAGVGPVGEEGRPESGARRRAPGRSGRRGRWTRIAALLGVLALASALLVVLPAAPASAVDRFFEVDSLSSQGDDVALGDGVCLTSAGRCTLRAALQESNALASDNVVIAPAADVDADTPGIQTSGTIVGSGSGAAYMMYVGTLTSGGGGMVARTSWRRGP